MSEVGALESGVEDGVSSLASAEVERRFPALVGSMERRGEVSEEDGDVEDG